MGINHCTVNVTVYWQYGLSDWAQSTLFHWIILSTGFTVWTNEWEVVCLGDILYNLFLVTREIAVSHPACCSLNGHKSRCKAVLMGACFEKPRHDDGQITWTITAKQYGSLVTWAHMYNIRKDSNVSIPAFRVHGLHAILCTVDALSSEIKICSSTLNYPPQTEGLHLFCRCLQMNTNRL